MICKVDDVDAFFSKGATGSRMIGCDDGVVVFSLPVASSRYITQQAVK